jgi:hypothetical protein
MRALVTPLFKRGKPIPRDERTRVFSGDLIVNDQINPVLQRTVREARLFGANGLHELDPLIDAQLTTMSSDGFVLRGFEYLADQQLAQEWWVRPAPTVAP